LCKKLRKVLENVAKKVTDFIQNYLLKGPIKRLALQKYYAKNPTTMPTKELEPLKFSKINKFTSKIEGNADIFGNTIITAFQTFESDDRAEGIAHLNNIFD
jgi:hypothetical protein